MERNGKTVLQLRTERNENGTIKKKERERNDLAEGPRSRTERNDFKKVGSCPALGPAQNFGQIGFTVLTFVGYKRTDTQTETSKVYI